MYRPRSLTVRVGLLRFPFTSFVVGRRELMLSSSCVSVGGACINNFTFFFFLLIFCSVDTCVMMKYFMSWHKVLCHDPHLSQAKNM